MSLPLVTVRRNTEGLDVISRDSLCVLNIFTVFSKSGSLLEPDHRGGRVWCLRRVVWCLSKTWRGFEPELVLIRED